MKAWIRNAAIGVAILAGTGCSLPLDLHIDGDDVRIRGSGRVVSELRFPGAFHTVSAHGASVVIVEKTGREQVFVTAEDNVIGYLETDVRGGVLHVGVRSGVSLSATREIVFEIEAIDAVEIIGSGAVEMEADLGRQPELWVSLSGASRLRTSGSVQRQNVNLSGASEYDALDLASERTQVAASGASRSWLSVRNRLDAIASGAARIWFAGNPHVVAKLSGGATVEPY